MGAELDGENDPEHDERQMSEWFDKTFVNEKSVARMFCFPHAGGSSHSFYGWNQKFPPDIELCPIQLPGRGKRITEQPSREMDYLAISIGDAMIPLLDKPFMFFGHSMGCLLAFEVARYLRSRHGRQPAHLFVSGRGAPDIGLRRTTMHDLPDDEFIRRLHDFNGTPAELLQNPEITQLFIPVLRADFEIAEKYRFKDGEPLECQITAFGGHGDIGVKHEDLKAWANHTKGQFSVHMFPGDHFFVWQSEHLVHQVFHHKIHSTMRSLR
jgi:medium-chain acyl-[acyl-carrier-protein] hydrolase